jgi:hypothetical protein
VIVQRTQRVQRRTLRSADHHRGHVVENLRPVGGQDGDRRSFGHAFRGQGLAELARSFPYFFVGGDGIAEIETGTVAVAIKAVDDQLAHHGRREQGFG